MVLDLKPNSKPAFQNALAMFQTSNFTGAEAYIVSALKRYPNEPNLLRLLGASLLKQNRAEEAEAKFTHVTRLVPNFAPAYENLAEAYLAQGKIEPAINALKMATRHDPQSTSLNMKLAELLSITGRAMESDQVFQSTLENHPDRAALAEAMKKAQTGDFKGAEQIYRGLLKTNPENVDALRLMGVLCVRRDNYNDAEALFRRAVELAPDYWTAWINYGTALNEQQKFNEADTALKQALKLKPSNVHTLERLGTNSMNDGRLEDAIDWLEKALEIDAKHFPSLLCLGHALKTIGRQDEAIAAYRRCAGAKPDFGEVYWSLANLKTFRFEEGEVEAMKQHLDEVTQKPASKDSEISFCFALGKACEDRKDYKQAYAYYERGNSEKRLNVNYDPIELEIQVDRLIDVFTQEYFAARQGQGCAEASPIFIVGLPRSGSTLLEQILASHSEVEGTAELHYLLRLATQTGLNRADGIKYPHYMLELAPHHLSGLGQEYLELTLPHRTGKPYFTDKLPNNFTGIGFLQAILPNAKIIDARRHPLDSCLGTFKQLFARGQPFSYDFYDLAHYYGQYDRLMKHWDKVLPGKILRVNYEQVVGDLETQAKRLIAHCGLAWEDQILRFHETKRAVKTASSEQVRQPIYKGSVHLWRHYEEDLSELIDFLEPVLMGLPEADRPCSLQG